MNDAYSPHTGEHIATDNPAQWMGRAGTPAPEYNSQTHGCFWRDGAWSLVAVAPPVDDREFKHFAPRDMLNLFKPERVAIMAAKASDVQVAIWYDDLIAARYVTYSDEATQQGLSYMLQAGLLTQARHDEIVSILTAEREG